MTTRMPILYVAHGGGPLPLLQPDKLSAFLQKAAKGLKPKAVLFISAHFEAPVPTLINGGSNGLLFDYSGFPAESYRYHWNVASSDSIARLVLKSLSAFSPKLESKRGLDHGVFVPGLLMFGEETSVPILQLSLLQSLDAGQHLELGKALASLPSHGVLIVGSGMSFHNMPAFFSNANPNHVAKSLQFHCWLKEVFADENISQRVENLQRWKAKAPEARFCHPREEHLLPLHVCVGAAGDSPARVVFDGFQNHMHVLSLRFE